jgi:hypothetical protein
VEDPVKVDPKHYTVAFENERVRVLRIAYGPNEKSVMHGHPDGVAVMMTNAQIRMHLPDGSTEDMDVKTGHVQWAPGGDHVPENLGSTPLEVVLVELKS